MGASRELAELASSYNSGGLSNMRNRIINGAMSISQRGTSFTASTASVTYTLDRWSVIPTGANVTVAQVAGIGGFPNALQITGAASNTQVYASQRIESANIADLAGTTATLSAVMQASTNNTVQWAAYYPNARDNYSSSTLIASGTFNATTSAQTFSAQINLPAQVANGLWVLFYPNNTGAFTSGTFTLTGVQLEKGSAATSFDYRDYGTELVRCQRYTYALSTPGGGATQYFLSAGGVFSTTTTGFFGFSFPQVMRAIPSLSPAPTAGNYQIYVPNGGAYQTLTGISLNTVTTSNFALLNIAFASGGTAGQGFYLNSTAANSAPIILSAEL